MNVDPLTQFWHSPIQKSGLRVSLNLDGSVVLVESAISVSERPKQLNMLMNLVVYMCCMGN